MVAKTLILFDIINNAAAILLSIATTTGYCFTKSLQ